MGLLDRLKARTNILVPRRPIMTKNRIVVYADGDTVVLRVGNAELALHYLDALTISQWFRIAAKDCKRNVGDTARHWSVAAKISDAGAEYRDKEPH